MGHPPPTATSVKDSPLPPLSRRLYVFAMWGVLVGVAFFGVYPTTNWLTGLRASQYELFIQSELEVPFVPRFIWLYLSMYLLFGLPPFFLSEEQLKRLGKELIIGTIVSGFVFLILPSHLGFSRVLPADDLYRPIFQGMFSMDKPYNLVPSLHVVYTASISAALMERGSTGLRAVLGIWAALVMISTVFVHQHHVVDVVSGLFLVFLMRALWEGKNG